MLDFYNGLAWSSDGMRASVSALVQLSLQRRSVDRLPRMASPWAREYMRGPSKRRSRNFAKYVGLKLLVNIYIEKHNSTMAARKDVPAVRQQQRPFNGLEAPYLRPGPTASCACNRCTGQATQPPKCLCGCASFSV